MTLAIRSHLVDGNSTKRFRTMALAAAYVREMEDFGEDGRRSWGFQGEFGTHEFVGFTWTDVRAAWAAADAATVTVYETKGGVEWIYDQGRSAQVWARAFVVHVGTDHSFDIMSTQGRFQVGHGVSVGPDDYHHTVIGTYTSLAAAVDACQRFVAAPVADPSFVSQAFWANVVTVYDVEATGVPF